MIRTLSFFIVVFCVFSLSCSLVNMRSYRKVPGHSINDFLLDKKLPYSAPKEKKEFCKVIVDYFDTREIKYEGLAEKTKDFIFSPDEIILVFQNEKIVGYQYFYILETNADNYFEATYLSIQFTLGHEGSCMYIRGGEITESKRIPRNWSYYLETIYTERQQGACLCQKYTG